MFRILLKMSIGIGRILVPRSGTDEFFRPFFNLRKGAGEKKKLIMIDLKIHQLQYFLKLRKPSELAFILNINVVYVVLHNFLQKTSIIIKIGNFLKRNNEPQKNLTN